MIEEILIYDLKSRLQPYVYGSKDVFVSRASDDAQFLSEKGISCDWMSVLHACHSVNYYCGPSASGIHFISIYFCKSKSNFCIRLAW
jgi:hypothetical protein